MGNGILFGAMAGFGKGVVDVTKQAQAHENELDRMERGKEIQLDLEKARVEFAETLRQKRAGAIQSAADPRIQSATDAGPIRPQDQNRILAEEAMRYDGNFGGLHTLDRQDASDARADRREDTREKQADRQITIAEKQLKVAEGAATRAAGADKRAQDKADLEMGELKTKLDYLKKYRTAFESGDTEGATKYGTLAGIGGESKEKLTTAASTYAQMANQLKDSVDKTDRDQAKLFRELADNLLQAAVGTRAPTHKPKPAGERPPLSAFTR